MTGYDSKLDNILFTKSIEVDNTRLNVKASSYNNGEKKVGITRELKNKDEQYKFIKLGRFNKKELEAIIPVLNEALTII